MTESPPDDVEPRQVLATGFATYGIMAIAALGWLAGRDRTAELHTQSFGVHGPWLGAVVGLATGLLMAVVMAWLSPRLRVLRDIDAMVARTFVGIGETAALLFVIAGALAEELLFRLAAQDALGLFGTVALYSLLYSSVGGWRWLLIMVPHALLLGLLVQCGFGLFASTTANAIMNHLNLRRLRC